MAFIEGHSCWAVTINGGSVVIVPFSNNFASVLENDKSSLSSPEYFPHNHP